jgi:transcriptional regulator with XRE-family HTH domain
MARSGTPAENMGRRKQFGRLLADALKARGMKQEGLASMLGTTQSSVSGWINAKYEPAADTVFAIERMLGVDPGHLSRPLGYLPVEPVARTVSVESAIAQSPLLDDEEKAALVAMYRVLANRSAGSANAARTRSTPSTAKRGQLAASPAAPARPRSVAGGR